MQILDRDVIANVEAAVRGCRRSVWERRPEWQHLELMSGVVGLGFCAVSIDRVIEDADTDALVDAVLARAVELFNAHGAGPSLHSGVAGLGLWLALNFDYPDLLESIDEGLIHHLAQRPQLLSLRGGIGGIALYAATRSATPTGRRLGDVTAQILAERASHASDTVTWVVPREYAMSRGMQVLDEPVLEAGMAHGHAGILVGLAALALAGNATAARLVAPALEWLWATARPPPNRYAWATFGWAGEHGALPLNIHTWCTGDPGVMRAAWLAARAIGHATHAERALALARAVADEVLAGQSAGVSDRFDLCCGAASVGHIFHRFFEETSEPRFREAAIATFTPLIGMLPSIASDSFQFGRTGILAALLTASTDVALDWDVALGMSLPRPSQEVVTDADLFRCRGIEVTAVDESRTILTMLADGEQVVAEAGVARVASACQRFASLGEHAAGLGEREADVMPILRGLVDGGLLVSKRAFVEALQPEPAAEPATATLRTIGMPTCNRPEAMTRGLDSYLANAIRHGRDVRAIVVDDSGDPAGQDRCRSALGTLARRHDREIRYAGAVEKRAFITRLARAAGVDPSVLAFAMFGMARTNPTYGGNRNALYLASAGESFFSADDDTTATVVVPNDAEPGVGFSSLYDPTRVRIVLPGTAFAGEPRDVDVLALHQTALGRSVADVIPRASEETEFEHCNAGFMAALERRDGRIRLSWMGIAGDAGSGSALYYMHHPHTDRSEIKTDDDYHARCRSTWILRAPRRLILGNGSYCQTTALAFDGTGLLPPFFPSEPGEDVVFGKLLRLLSPDSLTAFQPYAISHVPIEERIAVSLTERRRIQSANASAGHVPFYMLMGVCLDLVTRLPGTPGEAAVLDALAKHFLALGALPVGDLAHLMRVGVTSFAGEQVRSLERHLRDQSDAMPPAYRDDLRIAIEMALSMIASDEVLPKEFAAGRTPAQAIAVLQLQLAAYGRLCASWPAIVGAARILNAEGQGLGARM